MRSKHRLYSQRRRFPGKYATRHPSSTVSPDKDTPYHDDRPLAVVVVQGVVKRTVPPGANKDLFLASLIFYPEYSSDL